MNPTSLLRKRSLVAIVGALAIGAGWLYADDVIVKRNLVDVLGGKGSIYPTLATAKKGESLHVVEQQGRWLKVQYNGQEGFVLVSSLEGPDVAPTNSGQIASGATSVDATAAGKGFGPDVYAKAHGYSLDGLKAMFANRDRLQAHPEKFEQFKSDGHVGAQ